MGTRPLPDIRRPASLLAALALFGACSENANYLGTGEPADVPAPTNVAGTGGVAAPVAGTGGVPAADAPIAGAGGPLQAGTDGAVTAGTGGVGDEMAGMGASGGAAGTPAEEEPGCELPAPTEFQPNPDVGGGGATYAESSHFRVYGSASDPDAALSQLEAAHQCFVEDWCFRSPGLSVHSDDGPYYKFNVYAVGNLGSAAGVMQYDAGAGLSYLEVLGGSVAEPRVVVHEYGHALTLTEYGWVDQTRTGAWWETVANWVADTYMTSSFCEDARAAHGISTGNTIIDLDRVIGQSHMLIVSDQNYYEAWPFLTYVTNNPDGYPGLGRMAIPNLFRNHQGNNDTPLHVLEQIAAPVSVQTILGRYWARMAYLDIGHPQAQQEFFAARAGLDFASLDSLGSGSYQVKPTRRPAYGGANIIPLSGTDEISIQVTNLGNGLADSNFTATLSIRATDGSVRYVDLPGGVGQTTLAAREEASLVVVNTPDALIQYDAFQTGPSSPEAIGLDYQVQITGGVPAD